MTMDLEAKIAEILKPLDDKIQSLQNKVDELEKEREDNNALLTSIKNMTTLQKVVEFAESQGLTPENFVAEAVIAALDQKQHIPLDIEVYNRLEARASGRGLNIEQLFNRSSFQEFVLDGLSRGAF